MRRPIMVDEFSVSIARKCMRLGSFRNGGIGGVVGDVRNLTHVRDV